MDDYDLPLELPDEIKKLKVYADKIKKSNSQFSYDEFEQILLNSIHYLKTEYGKHFKYKLYSDNHIGEVIFEYFHKKNQKDTYIKCAWQCILSSLVDFLEDTKRIYDKGNPDSQFVCSHFEYFWDFVFDIILFIDHAERSLDENHRGYGFGKRQIATSKEIFENSVDHLLHRLHIDTFSSFVRQSTSAFLLRQAIELRVKNALGINIILDKNDLPLKLTGDFFIDFIFNNDKIVLPIEKSLLVKIHKWTNYYIHAGWIPEVWKLNYAQKILLPLYYSDGNIKKGWSLHGAIKIDKEYYEKKMDNDIKEYIIQKYRGKSNKSVLFGYFYRIKKIFIRNSMCVISKNEIKIIKMNPEALITKI